MKLGLTLTKSEAKDLRRGDILRPSTLWNKTERWRKLPETITVTDIRQVTGSQTGVLLRVDFINGGDAWLDAGWFEFI
jgi:hypothetical protein